MSKQITILRIDPERRIIAKLKVKRSVPDLRRVVRSSEIATGPLPVAAGRDPVTVGIDPKVQGDQKCAGWRLLGHSNIYNGVSIIVGVHSGRAISSPVSPDWLLKRIEWIAPENRVKVSAEPIDTAATAAGAIRDSLADNEVIGRAPTAAGLLAGGSMLVQVP